MRGFLIKTAIIGVLGSLLAGCTALRLAYNNGPLAAWWWLDGYLDVTSEHAPRVKAAIDLWFDTTRHAQLPAYAALLARAQQEIGAPASPAQACRWATVLRDTLDPAVERGIVQAADLVPGLGEAQLRHLEQRFLKKNAEMRRDFLQPDLDERREAAVKRTLERAETLYGSLDEPQRKLIAAGIAASPFDPQAWLAEREQRQRDTVQTLRRLLAERADRDRTVTALRMLFERSEASPNPVYRSYQQRLTDYNCAFAAQIHNATTPAQRRSARERLKGWEDDLRALAAPQ
ncbi:MAG: DUF6279 family lipoprotein [Rubrivivax sp.]